MKDTTFLASERRDFLFCGFGNEVSSADGCGSTAAWDDRVFLRGEFDMFSTVGPRLSWLDDEVNPAPPCCLVTRRGEDELSLSTTLFVRLSTPKEVLLVVVAVVSVMNWRVTRLLVGVN